MHRPPRLRAGERLILDSGRPSHPLEARVDEVRQRNWSRCGFATVAAGTEAGSRLFLKQFVDARGGCNPEKFAAERTSAAFAQDRLRALRHPLLQGHDDQRLLLAFEALPMETPERLHHAGGIDPGMWQALLDRLPALLEELTAPDFLDAARTVFPHRPSVFPSAQAALVFKGLNLRNVGVPTDQTGARDFFLFDLGPGWIGPVEEASAKYVVSALLLNWGKPLHAFFKGPPRALVRSLAAALGDYSSQAAVAAELEHQFHSRRFVIGRNRGEAATKAALLSTVGRLYGASARRCLHLPELAVGPIAAVTPARRAGA